MGFGVAVKGAGEVGGVKLGEAAAGGAVNWVLRVVLVDAYEEGQG